MLSWIIRRLAQYWSRNKGVYKLNILTYHRVSEFYDEKNPQTISLALFKLQMKWLKKYFVVLPLPEAISLHEKNALPPRAICITIDDGYRDSYDLIYKVLQQENITATFFISTQGIVDGGLWDAVIYSAIFNAPDKVKEVKCAGKTFDLTSVEQRNISRYKFTDSIKYLSINERQNVINELKEQTEFNSLDPYFLTEEQIKTIHANGMTIGAHTHSHPILLKEDDEIASKEIEQSKNVLEKIIGAPVEFFAYPNGKYEQDFNDRHIQMVDELGFRAAFSTDWGSLSNIKEDRFKIKRFTPWDETELSFVLRLALNYRN